MSLLWRGGRGYIRTYIKQNEFYIIDLTNMSISTSQEQKSNDILNTFSQIICSIQISHEPYSEDNIGTTFLSSTVLLDDNSIRTYVFSPVNKLQTLPLPAM